jgi:endonuclease
MSRLFPGPEDCNAVDRVRRRCPDPAHGTSTLDLNEGKMTWWKAVQEVFDNESGTLTTREVTDRIYARYPDRPWKENTVSCHLIGMSINHPSSRHYPSTRTHACLFSLGNGRDRRWNPEQDGTWVLTDDGVQLVDDSQDALISEDEAEDESVALGLPVSLERDLEMSLLADLGQLEPGLKLFEAKGVNGYQLGTGVVGRLDILATDSDSAYVVIELKAGEADEKACAQLPRHMGSVKPQRAKEKPVRGILVANAFHERAKYAAEVVPDVALKRYQVSFEFLGV